MKNGSEPVPVGGGASGPVSGSPPGGVRVETVEVGRLCDESLRARLMEIGRARSGLEAMYADTLGEIARRDSAAVAEQFAKEALLVSGRAARADVKTAVALGELDATRSGLASGLIAPAHAQLIARAAGDAPIDERFLAARAAREGYDQFRRTVARHVADCSGDDGESLLERQRRSRAGRVFTRRDDGMVVLNLELDPVTGARVSSVVAAAERAMFRDEDPKARPTPAQRTADAITRLLVEPGQRRPAGTTLLVVADYDMINHQLRNTRLADGTPIPIGEIAKAAVDMKVLPVIFDDATADLRMGRTRRTATELQRAALALRDQGCVGCGMAPERCYYHHVAEWQYDGPTDYANLVTVCNDCHKTKIHEQGFTVEADTRGRFHLQAPADPPNKATGSAASRGLGGQDSASAPSQASGVPPGQAIGSAASRAPPD